MSGATNKDLVNELVSIIRSFKCGSMWSDESSGWTIIDNFQTISSPQAKSLYFSSYDECLSKVKLNSVKINRSPMTVKTNWQDLANPIGLPNNCELTVNAANLEWDFSPSAPTITGGGMGPLGKIKNGDGDYWWNLVCEKGTGKAKCGIPSTDACPGFDSSEMVRFFNLLYPTYTKDICSNFQSIPPYQCISTDNPTFISALGSTLAIMNTVLVVLFSAAVYMFQNGYELPGVLGSSSSESDTSGKIDDVGVGAKELEMGTDLKPVNNPIKSAP